MSGRSALDEAGEGRRQLIRVLSEAAAIAERHRLPAEAAHALARKLKAGAFEVLVVGAFKRGKSTLNNALLGDEVLPSGVIPVTSVATRILHADTPGARVQFGDGRQADIPIAALADYVSEARNPDNAKGVAAVEVRHPSRLLRSGVQFVDTPGIGSVHAHQTEAAYEALLRADAIVLVLAADPPFGEAEVTFLNDARAFAGKLFVVMNKVDRLTDAQRAEALRFTADVLATALGQPADLFPLSALDALAAARASDGEVLARSGLIDFRARLDTFLAQGRDEAQRQAARRGVLRFLAWQDGAEATLRPSAEALMKRYAARVAGLVDDVEAISADLFDLPGHERPALEEPIRPLAFEPRSVEHVSTLARTGYDAALGILPAAIARARVVHDERERVAFLLDCQVGWMRQDLTGRLGEALTAFEREVGERLDAAIAATEAAIRRGLAQREAAAALRLAALEQDLAQLAARQPEVGEHP